MNYPKDFGPKAEIIETANGLSLRDKSTGELRCYAEVRTPGEWWASTYTPLHGAGRPTEVGPHETGESAFTALARQLNWITEENET
jgi:hypothetical protein